MRDLSTTLGGTPVRVLAPQPGDPLGPPWTEFATRDTFGLDTETTAIEQRGRGIWYPGFRIRTVQVAALDPDGTSVTAWVLRMDDPGQEAAARALLADPDAGFISHTAYDTLAVWRHFGLDIAGRSLDTLVLARLAQKREVKGGRPESFGLKALTATHLGAELPDAQEALHEEFARLAAAAGISGKAAIDAHGWDTVDVGGAAFVTYAALDAVAEVLLAPLLIREGAQPDHVLAAEQWTAAACARQTIDGFRLDWARVESAEREATALLEPLAARHAELSGARLSQGWPALGAWLTERGFDPDAAPVTATGTPSLAREELPGILTDPAHTLTAEAREVLEARLAAAEAQADRRTLAQWRRHADEGGLLHPRILSLGTATGRIATAAPNLQNVAPRLRGCIIPREGWRFAAIDLDQVELRVAHAHAGEPDAIATVREGGDLHQLTADGTGVSRKVAKTMNFQLLYGSGATGIARKTGLSLPAARQAVAAFWRAYPRLTRLKTRLEQGTGRVTLASGRRVPAPWGREKGRPVEPKGFARLNYLIQGSCRDLLIGAWMRLEREHGFGRFVALTIHDEMLLHAPADLLPEVMAAAKRCLSFTYLGGMPINADPDLLLDTAGTSRWMKGEQSAVHSVGVAA